MSPKIGHLVRCRGEGTHVYVTFDSFRILPRPAVLPVGGIIHGLSVVLEANKVESFVSESFNRWLGCGKADLFHFGPT